MGMICVCGQLGQKKLKIGYKKIEALVLVCCHIFQTKGYVFSIGNWNLMMLAF